MLRKMLHLHTCWMLRKMLGWGGGDVNVPCTCTHVGCYARCWVGVGGMLTFLALAHMLDATQMLGWCGGDVNVPCTCTHVGCYARCWVGVGGMLTFLALAHMLEKKDAADSLLKFKRALNADATYLRCFFKRILP